MRRKKIKNRLAIHPMEGNDALENGGPSERTFLRYRRLAEGGAGLVCVEAVSVSQEGKARKRQMVLNRKTADSFVRLLDVIRKTAQKDPPLIIVQIGHSGRFSISRPLVVHHNQWLDAATGIPKDYPLVTRDEILKIEDAFVAASKILNQAAVDGIDFKCCHGYLGGEFLRPANKRPDDYGGSFENRVRFFEETVEKVKSEIDNKRTLLGARISAFEGIPGGFGVSDEDMNKEDLSELRQWVSLARKRGLTFISVSAGIPQINSYITRPKKGNCNPEKSLKRHYHLAEVIKTHQKELVVIGAGYSYLREKFLEVAEKHLRKRIVDLVGIGRQAFADPDFPKKILNAKNAEIRYCQTCRRNSCSTLLAAQVETGCTMYDSYYRNKLKEINRDKIKA